MIASTSIPSYYVPKDVAFVLISGVGLEHLFEGRACLSAATVSPTLRKLALLMSELSSIEVLPPIQEAQHSPHFIASHARKIQGSLQDAKSNFQRHLGTPSRHDRHIGRHMGEIALKALSRGNPEDSNKQRAVTSSKPEESRY